jgi:hypothetical protein
MVAANGVLHIVYPSLIAEPRKAGTLTPPRPLMPVPDVLFRRLLLPAALLALIAAALFATTPAASAKAKTCGEKVVDDWYGDGRVDEVFPTHCYLDAIRSLPVDVKDYSNAEEDIRRALAYAQQHKPDPGPTGGPAPTGTGSGPVAEPPTTDPVDDPTVPTVTTDDPESDTLATPGVDTSGPSSVPIPLLILGGLALLLLAAGGAGYLSRRAQARRNGGPPGPA